MFRYSLAGKEYCVSDSIFLKSCEGVEGEGWFTKDRLRLIAAREAFFREINGQLKIDDSRSFVHTLKIDGVLIWRKHWQEGETGDFRIRDFYEKMEEHLLSLGLIESKEN